MYIPFFNPDLQLSVYFFSLALNHLLNEFSDQYIVLFVKLWFIWIMFLASQFVGPGAFQVWSVLGCANMRSPSGSGPLLLLDQQSFTVSTVWSTSFVSIQLGKYWLSPLFLIIDRIKSHYENELPLMALSLSLICQCLKHLWFCCFWGQLLLTVPCTWKNEIY